MGRLLGLLGVCYVPLTLHAQADAIRPPDPAPDRGVIVATARQLPSQGITASGHFFGLLPTMSAGLGGWSTWTIGTSPLILLGPPVTFLLFGSVKARVVEHAFGALAVGDFFAWLTVNGGDVAAHWPFLAGTLGGDAVNVTGTLGYGFGGGVGGLVDKRLAWQATASARIGPGARLIAEWHDLSPGEAFGMVVLRLWGQNRTFIELGGFRQFLSDPGSSRSGRWFPWIGAGYRIR